MPLSPKLYTWLCGCFVALGSMLFGYDLGIIGSILPSETFKETVGFNDFDKAGKRIPNRDSEGLIVSFFVLGGFFGAAPAGTLADILGRRKAIIIGCVIFLVGGCLQTGAKNLAMIVAGRWVAGFGTGMLTMMAPLYQSEIAHPSIRGRLTTLQQFFLGIGALIASFIGYGTYNGLEGSHAQWRIPLGIQMVPAVPLALCILFFPESPRWLAKKGHDQLCLETLARLHAHGNVEDPFVVSEHRDIKESIERERLETAHAFKQLVTIPSNFRRLMLGIILQFSVQMTGVSAIQYYSPQIFAQVGFDASQTLLLQSINSVIALGGEVACILLVDRLGRRWPLILANALSSTTYVVGTAIIATYPAATSNNRRAHWAFVMMTWVFNFAFSSAIGPLSWAYPVEIFNTATRAKATSITSMFAWIANFMIAQVTPKAFENIGWRYYLVFAVCGYTNALTVWALFPETKGRKLEEMDEYFSSTGWFVPLQKYEPINHLDRENEMRLAGEQALRRKGSRPSHSEKDPEDLGVAHVERTSSTNHVA